MYISNGLKNYYIFYENNFWRYIFFRDKMLFVRITNNFCIDGCNYGRNFMEKNNLYKKRVQNEKNKDFYK